MLAALGSNLEAMYGPGTDPARRRAADVWLQKLQREQSGWGLADAILGGRTPFAGSDGTLGTCPCANEAVTFAALTLHAKVSGDLHELSPDQAVQLRGAALGHLDRWATARAPGAVVKKLGLSVAALAVSTSWTQALAHVQARFQSDDARTKVVAVELLAALPEQCAWKQSPLLSSESHDVEAPGGACPPLS